MVFNVVKIASARASSTISLTKSLRVARAFRVCGRAIICRLQVYTAWMFILLLALAGAPDFFIATILILSMLHNTEPRDGLYCTVIANTQVWESMFLISSL